MARSPGCPGWVLCGRCRVGGFGWLMSEKMLGVFLASYGCDFCVLRGWGGVDV